MLILSTILNRAADTVGAYVPRIGACLALLIIGYLVAVIVGRLTAKTLQTVGLDHLADRIGVTRELTRFGAHRSASRVVGTAVRLAILVVSIVAAISALGLSALDASLNSTVLFLPKIFAALLLLLVGVIAGRYVRERVEQAAIRMDLAGPLGPLAEGAIIAVFATTALAQLSVPLVVLTLILAIMIAAACFAAALAFGLGSRDTARQITAGRTLISSLHVGQQISIGLHSGRIEAFQPAAILLRTADAVVRIPNQLLLESVITLHDADAAPTDE